MKRLTLHEPLLAHVTLWRHFVDVVQFRFKLRETLNIRFSLKRVQDFE